jgi:hypothetical protein
MGQIYVAFSEYPYFVHWNYSLLLQKQDRFIL